MRVFIDLGAHTGDTIRASLNWHKKRFDRIYAFEPRNKSFKELEKNFSGRDNVFLFNAAADTTTGIGKLYLGKDGEALGSSLCSNKTTCFKDKVEIVKTLDFSKFIIDNFSLKDRILLKIDIEGKEYNLLDKMMKDGSIEYINEIYCEWHYDTIGITEERHLNFVKKLRKLGFKLTGNNQVDEFIHIVKMSKINLRFEKFKCYYIYQIKAYLKNNFPELYFRIKRVKMVISSLKPK